MNIGKSSDLIGDYIRKCLYPIPPLSPLPILFGQRFALPNCLIFFIKIAQQFVYGVLHKIRVWITECTQTGLRRDSGEVRIIALRKRGEEDGKVLKYVTADHVSLKGYVTSSYASPIRLG